MKEEINLIWGKLGSWYETFIAMLPNIILALAIGIGIFFIARGVRVVVSKYLFARWENIELKKIVAKVVQIVVIALGFMMALSIVELDKTVTSILAGVGVIGLALGFAFQDIAANFISGVFMASSKPFAVGDTIEVNDTQGVIQEIKLRTTIVKTFQGNDVIIPNTDLFQNQVTNYTANQERRIDLEVGVSYSEDLKVVKETSISAIKGIDGLQEGKDIVVLFTEFGGSSINLEVRFWTPNGTKANWLQVRSDAIEAIKTAYDSKGISIPFPIRTLEWPKGENIMKKAPMMSSDRTEESNEYNQAS
ncbi:MAG: mechanosensitive ion channel family protein [Flavobacteriales bacterium]|nr:mechanosensitive ion channel family protein [Flavobacteriales bacterium]